MTATNEANEELRRLRIARGLPGAYRVENKAGLTVARYIVDHRGIAWANILAAAPISPEDRRRRAIAAVLELIADGELVRVQVA
jgi:hypothetical protein